MKKKKECRDTLNVAKEGHARQAENYLEMLTYNIHAMT